MRSGCPEVPQITPTTAPVPLILTAQPAVPPNPQGPAPFVTPTAAPAVLATPTGGGDGGVASRPTIRPTLAPLSVMAPVLQPLMPTFNLAPPQATPTIVQLPPGVLDQPLTFGIPPQQLEPPQMVSPTTNPRTPPSNSPPSSTAAPTKWREQRKDEMPKEGFLSLPTLATTSSNTESELPTASEPLQQQPTSKPLQADAEKSNNYNQMNDINNNNNKEEANDKQTKDEQVESRSTTDLKELMDEVLVRSVELKLTYLSLLARRLNHIDILGLEKPSERFAPTTMRHWMIAEEVE